jgi:hypothetical protein
MAGTEPRNTSRAGAGRNQSPAQTTYYKRYFLDCRSLAEMAITLVAVGAMLLIPTIFLCVLILVVIEDYTHTRTALYTAMSVSLGFWALPVILMWRHFVRIGRAWSEPRLDTKEFSYFQWVSTAFVLFFVFAFQSAETLPAITGLRWFMNALFVMVNLAYVTLAIGINSKFPTKIFGFLIIGILGVVLSIWM